MKYSIINEQHLINLEIEVNYYLARDGILVGSPFVYIDTLGFTRYCQAMMIPKSL